MGMFSTAAQINIAAIDYSAASKHPSILYVYICNITRISDCTGIVTEIVTEIATLGAFCGHKKH
jgi:hypothetical protein